MPLLPRHAPRRAEWDALFALKRRLGVSVAALLHRTRTLGVLTESAYRRAIITMSERGWRTSEPHDIPTPETPRLLRAAIELLQRERNASLADLADRARLPHELVTSVIEPPRLRLDPTKLTTSAPS